MILQSRKLAGACRENFVFMYLAEKVQPNFRTIARFRRNNKEDEFKYLQRQRFISRLKRIPRFEVRLGKLQLIGGQFR